MPFVAYGNAPTFLPKGFCCLKIGDKWKLHHLVGDTYQRVNTGLPDDATECSPTADFENGKWTLTFIAGGFEADRRFYLYKIDDLENPVPEKVVAADVGFIWKNRIVFGNRIGELKILDGTDITLLRFISAQYLYRVSYNPSNPSELLISGQFKRSANEISAGAESHEERDAPKEASQYKSGEIFSWICNPVAKRLQSLCVKGEPAYKAALFNDTLYYAQLGENDDFEERHIVETNSYKKIDLNFDEHIKISKESANQSTKELLLKFTKALSNWAKSGFKIADAETLAERKSHCSKCEYWQPEGFFGFGRCAKCGCSSAKLRLETEHCPIGGW